jgi:hypothetical protein
LQIVLPCGSGADELYLRDVKVWLPDVQFDKKVTGHAVLHVEQTAGFIPVSRTILQGKS